MLVYLAAAAGRRGRCAACAHRVDRLDELESFQIVFGIGLERGAAVEAIEEMPDRPVVGGLVAVRQVVALLAVSRTGKLEPAVAQRDRAAVADELEIVDQGRWMAMGQEIADQHDRCAGGGSEAHGGAVFAGEIGTEPRDRGGLDRHGAEQEAKRVDVMDQYLHHQQPLLRLEERLSRERRPHPIGLRQEARGQDRHAALMHAPDGAVIEPGLELAIVGPETPVLVHHQPRAGAGEA